MYVFFYYISFNRAKTIIKNFDTVNTSSPSFLKIMKSLELNLKNVNKTLQISCDGGAATGKSTGATMIAKSIN